MAGPLIKFPASGKSVEGLLLWHDVKKSGIVLGSIIAVYIGLCANRLTDLALVAYAGLLVVGLVGAWNVASKYLHWPPPSAHYPKVLAKGLDAPTVAAAAEKARVYINQALAGVRGVLGGGPILLLQATAILFFLSICGRFITITTLLFIVAVIAFTVPKAYYLKYDEVDKLILKVEEAIQPLLAKLQPHLGRGQPRKAQ